MPPFRPSRRRALTPVAVLFALIALATTPSDGRAQAVNCAGAPADARLDIPAPLDQIMTVYCTPRGHLLHGKQVPGEGVEYLWTAPEHLQPVLMYAKPGGASSLHGAYFTEFHLADLVGMSKDVALERFSAKADYKGGEDMRAYSLRATNNEGLTRALVIFHSTAQTAGFICADGECSTISPFYMIVKRMEQN